MTTSQGEQEEGRVVPSLGDFSTPPLLRRSDDWTAMDANNVLALALNRWVYLKDYGEAVREMTYSNGTEHGFAQERAELVLELGPMLRMALEEGVRQLSGEPAWDAYILALTSGDSDAVIAAEQKAKAAA